MSQPVRVLIAHYLPHIVSGAERSIADFAGAVGERLELTMLVPGEGPLAEFYRQRGFPVWVRKVETPRRMLPGLHEIQSYALARELRRRGFAVVISNTFAAAYRLSTAARWAGVPHAMYAREFPADRPANRRILQQVDRVLAISRDLQAYLQGLTEPSKVGHTYNYIDPQPILATYEKHRLSGKRALPFPPEAGPAIGLIGRITRFKQPHLLIEAAPRVLAVVPNVQFVIVGSARPEEQSYADELQALAQRLGVANQVHFLGNRRDNIELTSELQVSCLASTREPLGRVVLEAHLVGTPMVATNVGGPAEIIQDGRTGLLFPPSGPDAAAQLAERIIRLLQDPGLAQRLTSAAELHVRETFASLNHVRRQEEEILALCQPKIPQPNLQSS